MSVRESLNQRPGLVAAAVLVLSVLAIYWVYSQMKADSPRSQYSACYTNDDGKSFFGDDINRIVPFQKGGKEAVKAFVFDVNGRKFVGYMAKLNDQARAAVTLILIGANLMRTFAMFHSK